jgi:hypothetical protein
MKVQPHECFDPGRVCPMYGTDHDILYLYIRTSAPQDRGEQRPLRDAPIGQDRWRGDAHIVGYYAPERRVKPREGLGHRGGAEHSLPPSESVTAAIGVTRVTVSTARVYPSTL